MPHSESAARPRGIAPRRRARRGGQPADPYADARAAAADRDAGRRGSLRRVRVASPAIRAPTSRRRRPVARTGADGVRVVECRARRRRVIGHRHRRRRVIGTVRRRRCRDRRPHAGAATVPAAAPATATVPLRRPPPFPRPATAAAPTGTPRRPHADGAAAARCRPDRRPAPARDARRRHGQRAPSSRAPTSTPRSPTSARCRRPSSGAFTPDGVRLDGVAAGSVFAKAGLRARRRRDRRVDGKPLRSLDDAADLYARALRPRAASTRPGRARAASRSTLRVADPVALRSRACAGLRWAPWERSGSSFGSTASRSGSRSSIRATGPCSCRRDERDRQRHAAADRPRRRRLAGHAARHRGRHARRAGRHRRRARRHRARQDQLPERLRARRPAEPAREAPAADPALR